MDFPVPNESQEASDEQKAEQNDGGSGRVCGREKNQG